QKNGHKGSLLSWSSRKGSTQIIQSDQGATPAYPECSIYRRALVLLPFGDKQNAVLDIFEVEGGKEHDWMANGNADYQQTLTTDLKAEKTLDNLAKDGKPITDSYPWGDSQENKYKHDKYGVESIFYGAFRNAKVSPIDKLWTATMNPTEAVPEGTPGAGPRAISTDPKPSMKLHWLYPLDGKAILAEAPRNRYRNELHKKKEARAAWSKERMQKIIINRKGDKLKSTFVALWEPHNENPFIGKTEKLQTIDNTGLAWKVSAENITKTVLYKAPELSGFIESKDIKSNGKFSIISNEGNSVSLDMTDGNYISTDEIEAALETNETLEVLKVESKNDTHGVSLKGSFHQSKNKAYKDQYVCFSQDGDSNRWFKVKEITNVNGNSKLILSQDPGFTFDSDTQTLHETFFPRRSIHGKASVKLPSWLNIKKTKTEDETLLLVRASNNLSLTLKDMSKDKFDVKVKAPNSEWKELDYKIDNGTLQINIQFQAISDDWVEVSIK
ncbi:MAG: hypothetical protein NE328_22405, partial [Lentisphaeraceae bacterium]|nr:hypothetical protein [Lentisphaeraceae bacterium]